MHPLIRVVVLIVFCGSMALARPVFLLTGAGILLLLNVLFEYPALTALVQLLKRLRWLLIAVLLVYGWWTPGEVVWSMAGGLSPTVEGLAIGMQRVTALVIIVAAVHLLLQLTTREELLPAIMQLIKPVSTGADRERLAVRILLTFEAVARVQSLVGESLQQQPANASGLSRLGQLSRGLYQAVLEQAAMAGDSFIDVTELAAPPLWQWLIPLAIGSATVLGY